MKIFKIVAFSNKKRIFVKNKEMEELKWQDYITATLGVIRGKPAIKGTRIGVDLILEKLSNGDTIEDLLEAYPHITRSAILACLAFASEHVKKENILQAA